jgi:uncharacterized protein YdgA (DUF945 family)
MFNVEKSNLEQDSAQETESQLQPVEFEPAITSKEAQRRQEELSLDQQESSVSDAEKLAQARVEADIAYNQGSNTVRVEEIKGLGTPSEEMEQKLEQQIEREKAKDIYEQAKLRWKIATGEEYFSLRIAPNCGADVFLKEAEIIDQKIKLRSLKRRNR